MSDTSTQDGAGQSSSEPNAPAYVSKGKRKFAVLFGYNGLGYKGLQIQSDRDDTIEEDLRKAIVKTGVIRPGNHDSLKKMSWSRAARTDKGVHALGQVVSLKMGLEPGMEDEFTNALNTYLPSQIRVHDVIRVSKSFNSYAHCFGRVYEYILPTYVFATHPEDWAKANAATDDNEETPKLEESEEELAKLRDDLIKTYRMPQDTFEKLRKALACFEGTKSYHNFTIRVAPDDPSRLRHMKSVKPEFLGVANGVEYVRVRIEGQSFMLHQIRKMIGIVVEISRRDLDLDLMEKAFNYGYFAVPTAPAEGLFLGQALFDQHNQKSCNSVEEGDKWAQSDRKVKQKEVDIRRPIQFSQGIIKEKVDRFREEVILPTIIDVFKNDLAFISWSRECDMKKFPFMNMEKSGGRASYDLYKDKQKKEKDAYHNRRKRKRQEGYDNDKTNKSDETQNPTSTDTNGDVPNQSETSQSNHGN